MHPTLEAQMLAERCQMYLRHLRGIVYLLNYEAQCIRPGQLPADWGKLMQQIQHLAQSTEKEICHYRTVLIQSGTMPATAQHDGDQTINSLRANRAA